MGSILTSIKKLLGITEEYEHFDPDIIMHINSAFMILNQLGVGPEEGFFIKDKSSTWDEFLSSFDTPFSTKHEKNRIKADKEYHKYGCKSTIN